jgi:hypothetical protein
MLRKSVGSLNGEPFKKRQIKYGSTYNINRFGISNGSMRE